MGDTSGTDRHMAGGIDAFDDDPFAELARLIDEPWTTSVRRRAANLNRRQQRRISLSPFRPR